MVLASLVISLKATTVAAGLTNLAQQIGRAYFRKWLLRYMRGDDESSPSWNFRGPGRCRGQRTNWVVLGIP